MNISHNWLQTYFKEKIPAPEKLAELFTFHSFEVEGMIEIKGENGKIADTVMDVKILPDMAHYCLSHEGVASEISFITGMKMNDRLAPEIKATIKDEPKVEIEDPKFCRRYMIRYVDIGSSRPSSSPDWLKCSLEAIGQRMISPLVDISNYVMYDIGQPMHAFDADKVKGSLKIRLAKDGERITLLDGRELILTAKDNVIADDEGPLVVTGAKGGRRAEISETTKKIIIESANFEPSAVRRTSTKYDIRSDSSKRFENEITQELASQGMANACDLVRSVFPDAKFGPIVDIYPTKPKQTVIEFDPSYIEERLGVEISLEDSKKILERMDIVVSSTGSASKPFWKLSIPYKRLDLVIKEDIVEEVGRIYGYDHVIGILPMKLKQAPDANPTFYLCEKIKNILTAEGFSEVILYTLVEKGMVETLKPLARDKAFARSDLTHGMASCLEKNALNADLLGLEAIKIFEIGHIFKKDSEEIHLAIGARQVKKVKGFKSEDLIKRALETLEKELSSDFSENGIFSKAKIQTNGIVEIDLSPAIKSFKPSKDVKDLDFRPASVNRYLRFSSYPFIVRDIAVFVPESIQAEEVWSSIEKGIKDASANGLLTRHSLFDTFKKEGKISYAFRMIFQSMEKTLTDSEVNGIMEKINGEVKVEGWEVR